jgi:hypothetical protein
MRITRKDLEIACNRLNEVAGTPKEYGLTELHIGHYTISGAYGGYALYQLSGTSGCVDDVFRSGHIKARELYGLIHAYMQGITVSKSV